MKDNKKLLIKIDLMPEIAMDDLAAFLDQKEEDYLLGVLNKKLSQVIEKELRNKSGHEGISPGMLRANIIKHFKVHPTDITSFEQSQVTSGGVSCDEIQPDTCGSKLVDNLYFTGEIMDINGICGGYNLQWAWASAYAAAEAIKAESLN